MEILYDSHNEVRNFDKDTQACVQYVAYKVQLILNWCEKVANILQVPLQEILDGMLPNISMHILGIHDDFSSL
jgi:hypothetical protein